MKKMIKNLMLVAVAAMAFVGCQNDNDEMNVTVKKTVFEFTANIEETTRSYFGEKEDGIYPTLWEGGEMVSLVVLNSADEIVATAHSTVEAEEGATTAKITATFEGELVNAAKLVAYIGSWDFNRTLDLDEQFASKVGKVNHTLISENTWDGAKAVVLNFSHAVAYGNMTITDSPIELSMLSKVIVALDEVEYSISIGDELESLNIWFACDADEDFETFKVSLVADNGVTYSKSVDMTEYAADKRLKFIKGHVSKFSISGFEKVAADHAVEFTKMAGPVSEDFGSWAGVGMKYTFSNDAGDTMQITFSEADGNPLKAGTYTFSSMCEDGCFYGNGTWIKLADADSAYISSGDVVVALEDDVYTVTYTGTIAGETYETTFTGNVAVWEYFEGHWYSDTNYGLWAKTVSGNVFFFDMYCDSSVGQVIPEGVYTYGWERPYFQFSKVNETDITDGTVTVAHLESGYKIDINVTDANSNNFEYSFSGIVALHDANNAFKNPPIEYKDITVETEMATVLGSYEAGNSYYGYGDSFDLYITTAEVDGETYELTLNLAIPKDESSNGLIPAKTYTLGAADYTLTSESMGDGTKFANATLTVAHEAAGYTLTFTGENVMKTEFILTYSGKIAKVTEYNDFRNPGDATKLATPENGQYTFNEDTKLVTITWDEVENAESYLISYDEVEETVNTNSYSFTGEFDTHYNISIVAVPANDSTLYKNSDSGWVSFTTPKDINAATDYNVTLTKITAIDGNTIRFEGDNSQDKLRLEFNPGLASIEAGKYAVVNSISSSTAMEVSYNSQFNMAEQYNTSYDYYLNTGDLVNVAKDGDEYTITIVTSAYINSIGATKSVKLVYTGKLEVSGDVDEGIVFTSAEAVQRNNNWYDVTFTNGTKTIKFGVATKGVNYWPTGEWSIFNSFDAGNSLDELYIDGTWTWPSSGFTASVSVVDGDYNIAFLLNGEPMSFKGQITGFTVPGAEPEPEPEPEPDSIVLTTITPLNETFDPGYYTWSFNFTDGTDNNKFAIAFYYNKASATSIVPGEYTFASELGKVNAPNFALDGRNPYYFEGINKKLATGSTVNVAVDGSVYTINMHFILSDGSEHNYKYVGEIVVEEPEPEPEPQPQQLDTPTNLKATPDVNEVTVSWSAVANAESYYVTCGDKTPQTVTTTTATFDGLEAGTSYNISVVAKANGYVDSPAASTTVITLAGGEAKQVSLTFFTDNGTSYIFKGNDGHNYLIAFRNDYTPGTFSLTDNTKFIADYCTWTANNTTYYGGTQFAEGDTLELINLGGAYKIIIRATVDGEPVVATCDSTTFY